MKKVWVLMVAGAILIAPGAAFAVKAGEVYEWCVDFPDGGRPSCRRSKLLILLESKRPNENSW